jgi:hypothetical protein
MLVFFRLCVFKTDLRTHLCRTAENKSKNRSNLDLIGQFQMPAIPSVLIIGVNPIVKVVVPLLRAFGFHIAHLWSPSRLTAEIDTLCQNTLHIESYSCSSSTIDAWLSNTKESYLIFICTDTDQHVWWMKKFIALANTKSVVHQLICMPPFNVDPKSLISIQQSSTQLCCYCYPMGFLPTFVKLKRFLTEERGRELGK